MNMKALKVGSLIRMHYSRNYMDAGRRGTHTYDILARVNHVGADTFSWDVEAHENVKDEPSFASYPLNGTALVAVLPRRIESGEWEIES